MRPALFVPIIFSLLVLGAHFLRSGSMLVVMGILGLIPLLLVRRVWVARLTQIVLLVGALEWLRSLVVLARWRAEQGEPLLRMVVILSVVAAVTLGSALLFQAPTLKRIYGLEGEGS